MVIVDHGTRTNSSQLLSRVATMTTSFKDAPESEAVQSSQVVNMTLPQAMAYAQHHYDSSDWPEAERLCRTILAAEPGYVDAINLLAIVAAQSGRLEEAARLMRGLVQALPDNPQLHSNYGNVLRELGQYELAIASQDQAIALQPDFASAYYNRGIALKELQQADAAVASFDQAIAIRPDYAEAYNNRGAALQALSRFDAAIASFEQAIAIKPDYAEAYTNLGTALQALSHLDAALLHYERAIAAEPPYAKAYTCRGIVLQALKQPVAAIASYDQALAIRPDDVQAHVCRGGALFEFNEFELALESYQNAISIKPDFEYLCGALLHTKMRLCDWDGAIDDVKDLCARIGRREKVSRPFSVLSLTDVPAVQRLAAEVYALAAHPPDPALGLISKRAKKEKVRVGYFSADFHNHATAYLMAELFEKHDKKHFELVAFSFGPDTQDEMRGRIASAFDQFLDVRQRSDLDVARLSRSLGIDIAVDLKGFTKDNRTGIFALRAAPIQVNYLGYPGTMGADYIDYLIADRTLIPEQSQQHYREKIAFLPDSYQVNDAKRKISDKVFSREELGLPATGFVFCCFNNNYKITPDTFDGWMRILNQVEGSALWLLEDNPTAASNLRKEAQQRGVDAQRLVFAKRMPISEHLARQRAADLFIDTLPCNAHTTASDALWAGLPVLTCTGNAFAGRVATSLLATMGLPELITPSQQAYEMLAVELASIPGKLDEIRNRLERNRSSAPLFDTPAFVRHIESAYTAMYERYHADQPPEHIEIFS
jgi:predicted O-linked N-acetylglucosamine transferase (SPINDLY family)